MADDTADGALGRTGNEPDLAAPGTIADLVRRANAAGFPTIATWVDHLEARYIPRTFPVRFLDGPLAGVQQTAIRVSDEIHYAGGSYLATRHTDERGTIGVEYRWRSHIRHA